MSVARLIATLALDATNFVRGIDKSKQAAAGLSPGLEGIRQQVGNLFSLARLEAAIDAFGRLAQSAIAAANEVTKLSKAAGAGAEGWQVLRNATSDAGLDTAALQTGLKKLHAAQTEALGGNQKLAAAFATLGVTARDLESLGTDRLFARISETLARQGRGAKENAALMDLLGSRGAALLPILKEIGASFDRLADEQKNAAAGSRVYSDEARALANELSTMWQSVKDSFTVGFLEKLNSTMKFFYRDYEDGITELAELAAKEEEKERAAAAAAQAAAEAEKRRADTLASATAALSAALDAEDKLSAARTSATALANALAQADRATLARAKDTLSAISETLDATGEKYAAAAQAREAAARKVRETEEANNAAAIAAAEAAAARLYEAEGHSTAAVRAAEEAENALANAKADHARATQQYNAALASAGKATEAMADAKNALYELQALRDAATDTADDALFRQYLDRLPAVQSALAAATATAETAAAKLAAAREKTATAYDAIEGAAARAAAAENRVAQTALATADAVKANDAAQAAAVKTQTALADARHEDEKALQATRDALAEFDEAQRWAALSTEEQIAELRAQSEALAQNAAALGDTAAANTLLLRSKQKAAEADKLQADLAAEAAQAQKEEEAEAKRVAAATDKTATAVLNLSKFLRGLRKEDATALAEKLAALKAAVQGMDFSGLDGLQALSGFRLPNFTPSQARQFAAAFDIVRNALSGVTLDTPALEAAANLLDKIDAAGLAGGGTIAIQLQAPEATALQLTLSAEVKDVFGSLATSAATIASAKGILYA